MIVKGKVSGFVFEVDDEIGRSLVRSKAVTEHTPDTKPETEQASTPRKKSTPTRKRTEKRGNDGPARSGDDG